MKKVVSVNIYVEVYIKDEDIENILKDYRGTIDSYAIEDDLYKQIAYTKVCLDSDFCEGVGEEGEDYDVDILSTEIEIE